MFLYVLSMCIFGAVIFSTSSPRSVLLARDELRFRGDELDPEFERRSFLFFASNMSRRPSSLTFPELIYKPETLDMRAASESFGRSKLRIAS